MDNLNKKYKKKTYITCQVIDYVCLSVAKLIYASSYGCWNYIFLIKSNQLLEQWCDIREMY